MTETLVLKAYNDWRFYVLTKYHQETGWKMVHFCLQTDVRSALGLQVLTLNRLLSLECIIYLLFIILYTYTIYANNLQSSSAVYPCWSLASFIFLSSSMIPIPSNHPPSLITSFLNRHRSHPYILTFLVLRFLLLPVYIP